MEEIHANLLDRLREAKKQGWLGEVAAIEASLAAAEQKLAAMDDEAVFGPVLYKLSLASAVCGGCLRGIRSSCWSSRTRWSRRSG
ncbi:hypothetical protein [Streptomyces sp. NPDC057696]|uniref:hypothetical protein n=1 Tax=Streptomyces sp. NPDC057696 TaxID=3346218 RepID=UPI00368AE4FB